MKKRLSLIVLIALLSLFSVVVVNALTPVDTFNDTMQESDVDAIACTTATGLDMIGGERDLGVTRTQGSGSVTADVDDTKENEFALSIGASTRGTALIQWDGVDGDCALDASGLGGINLNPDDGMAIHVTAVDLNGVVTLRVYTDAANYSTFSYTIPTSVSAPGYVMYFPFEGFTPVGTGADFSDVGAIEVLVDGTGIDSLDMTIDFVNSDITRDFGDLPVAYNNISLLVNDGARHSPAGITLGSSVDMEADAQTSADATGDNTTATDDENGVTRSYPFGDWGNGIGALGINTTLPAGHSEACVVGWIDWDNSGSFDVGGTTGGKSELVLNDSFYNGSDTSAWFQTPTTANYGGAYPSTLNARFRIFEQNALIFDELGLGSTLDGGGCPTNATEAQMASLLTGLAYNGEVEDYQWSFGPNAVTVSNASGLGSFGVMSVLTMGVVAAAVVIVRKRK